MTEEKAAQKETIQELSLSYRIYLLSRRDFQNGVLIGVSSSLAINYLAQLDVQLNNGALTTIDIIVRVLLSFGILGYLIYNHRKRTKNYETLLKKISEKVQKINEEIGTETP
jgi:hypothetical protein